MVEQKTHTTSSSEGEKTLLLDGRSLSCLAFARQLDRSGTEVDVGESFRSNITAYSGAISEAHTYPCPEQNPGEFKRVILNLAASGQYDFIMPMRDATTASIASIQDDLPETTNTVLDSPRKIESLRNKKQCAKLAKNAEVRIPETYFPSERTIETIEKMANFPVVLKPVYGSGARGIRRVESPEQLEPVYREARREHSELIVQEFVDHAGGHFSIGTVFDQASEPRAIHVYEELIQYPDSGGPAIRARTVPVEPWVDGMLDILRWIDWTGPAHMDVLFDPADHTYKLLEVNPRIWMSLNLTVQTGVDVPNMLRQMATGNEPTLPRSYNTEMEYRWVLPNEILWLLSGNEKIERLKQLWNEDADSVCYGILSKKDPGAVAGVFAQSLRFLSNEEKRKQVLGRGWEDD